MRQAMGTEWLTVEEIAQELKMHVDTVRGWIRDGKLKATRFGRDYRVRREDFDKFVEERTTPGDTEKK
jgi:excisionase family DNA binding protein